jgi:NADPH:quinone reductase-like Zn-dependent oxidoreductase
MREFYSVSKAGSLKNLHYGSSPVPEIAANKVLIAVRAIGLNYADLFAIMGLYSATPKGSFIPGLEFSGTVLDSNSPAFIKGENVIGVTKFGGYDSHIVADPEYLIPLPPDWSFEQGAAFPVQTLTAFYALKTLGDIRKGQTVLIHSAAGGVGLQANRIAKKYDAYTIGVVGHAEKTKVLNDEGFDKALVRGPDFRARLAEALSGKELNLVLEATGGKFFTHSYDALAPMGRLVAYGSAQFTPASDRPNYLVLGWKYLFRPRIDPLSMITANKSVMAFNLIWIYEKSFLLKELISEIDTLQLPPPLVGHSFPFSNMANAISLFKSGKTIGKVVVTTGS